MHKYFLKYKSGNKEITTLSVRSETTNYVCSKNRNKVNRSYVAMCFNLNLN